MHNFNDSLRNEKLLAEKTKQLREYAYQAAFPGLQLIGPDITDLSIQKAGADRVLHLRNGHQIFVQEKYRTSDYGDIALEYDSGHGLGWIEGETIADYLAYLVVPAGRVELFPMLQLQAAWRKFKTIWLAAYGTTKAYNENYTTLCCPVPADEIWRGIREVSKYQQPVVTVTPQQSAADRFYAELGIDEPVRPRPCKIEESELNGWAD